MCRSGPRHPDLKLRSIKEVTTRSIPSSSHTFYFSLYNPNIYTARSKPIDIRVTTTQLYSLQPTRDPPQYHVIKCIRAEEPPSQTPLLAKPLLVGYLDPWAQQPPTAPLLPALPILNKYRHLYMIYGKIMGLQLLVKTFTFSEFPDEAELGRRSRIKYGVVGLAGMKELLVRYNEVELCQLPTSDMRRDVNGRIMLPSLSNGPPPPLPGSYRVTRTDAGDFTHRRQPWGVGGRPIRQAAGQEDTRRGPVAPEKEHKPKFENRSTTSLPSTDMSVISSACSST